MTCPFHFNRRTFLASAATATAALGVQATTQAQQADSPRGDGTPRSDNATVNNPEARLEFHGEHQQGIINQPQKYAEIVALDIQQGDRARLEQLLRTITERSRALTAGGATAVDGIAFPASDSGELGPDWVDIPLDAIRDLV